MAANPITDLVMAAALLKGSSPHHFQLLCNAIRAFEVQAIAEMCAGDAPHDIFRAQGKVKTVQQLRKHLVECTELRDKYTRSDHDGRPPAAG